MPFPMPDVVPDGSVTDAAHLIQTALTPVFLLTGIGTLLGLFNTRLATVAGHLENVGDLLAQDPDDRDRADLKTHEQRLRLRVLMLDASVVLGAIGGAATCASICTLFFGTVRNAEIANWLIGLFGLALVCTIGALGAFLVDSLLAWHGIRNDGPLPLRPRRDK